MECPNLASRCLRRQGFTLVELLVVISIIAILLAILLPSLRKAREQGKHTACVGHLHELSTAIQMYVTQEDRYPIVLIFSQSDSSKFGFTSWGYGGWEGSNTAFWKNLNQGQFHSPTNQRPLSGFMYPHAGLGEGTELAVFRCPSDRISRFAKGSVFAPLHEERLSAYQDYGTSYSMNITWWWQVREFNGCGDTLQCWQENVKTGNQLWMRNAQRNAGRFVMLGEDPFIGAVLPHNEPIEVMGLHGKLNSHNMAFLDGHVANTHTKTLGPDNEHSYRGNDWTVIDADLPKPIPLPT